MQEGSSNEEHVVHTDEFSSRTTEVTDEEEDKHIKDEVNNRMSIFVFSFSCFHFVARGKIGTKKGLFAHAIAP